MLIPWLAVVGGLIMLVWSAERFVHGAAGLARNLGVSPLVIGMTIMGFGTSAPEMLVAGMAASGGNPSMGIGNALGSNIANIALVLGITALIMPLTVDSGILRREFPVLFAITLLAGGLMLDGDLSTSDGGILLGSTALLLVWMVWLGKRSQIPSTTGEVAVTEPLSSDFENEIPTGLSTGQAIFWAVIGLVALVLSSKLLVWGAVDIARDLGISDLIIGLTIIAVGTSLPELAASVMSALKGEDDMAVGNIIGSNMFNLLAVLALPGLIAPSVLAPEVMQRDFPVVLALTVALFLMAYGFKGPGRINRLEGGLLVVAFGAYMAWLGFTGLS
ncbi:MAG: calcium/sodium antiporter [Ectothiorhodospiraceae bacterium]|nr:calcium/sodium antiporter [Ectothiorhodospiraceae bacterium]